MRFSSQRAPAPLLPVLAGALLIGCEQAPHEPSSHMTPPEPQLSHGPNGEATASATLVPVNDSGVRGIVAVLDDGSEIMVAGLASGLDPANEDGYGSAFYDLASPLLGPNACQPGSGVGVGTDHPMSLTLAQMTIGSFFLEPVWEVEADGKGTFVEMALEYVSVDRIGTVSIRDLRINNGRGPAAVVACGKVTSN